MADSESLGISTYADQDIQDPNTAQLAQQPSLEPVFLPAINLPFSDAPPPEAAVSLRQNTDIILQGIHERLKLLQPGQKSWSASANCMKTGIMSPFRRM